MDATNQEPHAYSLGDVTGHSGTAAVFRAGATGGGHHWELRSAHGDVLAVTCRVHNGGRGARAFWKLVTLTGMDAGNDIHAQLLGSQGRLLARISSTNDAPAVVTVFDDSGSVVAKSRRDKTLLLKVKHPDIFVVTDADDHVIVSIDCDADPPWQVLDGEGTTLGELFAGRPGPTLSPRWSDWIEPQWGLSVAAYANAQHLGIARAQQYTVIIRGELSDRQSTVMALLPLIAGMSY